jgi:hypothetical protein
VLHVSIAAALAVAAALVAAVALSVHLASRTVGPWIRG